MFKLLFSILKERRYLITAIILFLIFVIIYLWATQFLIWEGEREGFFEFTIDDNWRKLIFRERAAFLYESIGILHIGGVTLFLSVMNILLASALGVLVGLNLAVSYYSFRKLALRGVRGFSSLLGTIPAIISGTACCVPTLILVIGLQMTATLAAVWPLFVPASFLLLIFALWWSLYKIKN